MLDLEMAPQELKAYLGRQRPANSAGCTGAVGDDRGRISRGPYAMPMGEVPARAFNELDPDGRIVVICHHGVRSLNVANWLRNPGV